MTSERRMDAPTFTSERRRRVVVSGNVRVYLGRDRLGRERLVVIDWRAIQIAT